jgi:tRNA(fMet)-specific endonuclease VapC
LILADTDVLIDYLAGRQPILNQVREYILGEQLQTSAVTAFELLCGAQPDQRGDAIRDFLSLIDILPVDTVAVAHAAAEQRRLVSGGFTLPTADALIAGIALANDLTLFTRNTKHFEKVAGLRILPPG